MIRRLLSMAILIGVLLGVPAISFGAVDVPKSEEYLVLLHGKTFVKGGQTYLPLEEVMDACQISAFWGPDSQDKIMITEIGNRYQIILNIDQETGIIYGGTSDESIYYMVEVVDDKVYFPLAFYQDMIDRDIIWYPEKNELMIIDFNPTWLVSDGIGPAAAPRYDNKKPMIKGLAPYKVETPVSRATQTPVSRTTPTPVAVATATVAAPVAKSPVVENTVVADSQGMLWPTTATRISSPYGPRGKEFHTGVDIDGKTGDPIYAALSGQVVSASWRGGYGYCIDLLHADGSVTRYAHLNTMSVKAGDTVTRGQVIAALGASGRATGDHLHFEVRNGKYTYNPMGYISVERRK